MLNGVCSVIQNGDLNEQIFCGLNDLWSVRVDTQCNVEINQTLSANTSRIMSENVTNYCCDPATVAMVQWT